MAAKTNDAITQASAIFAASAVARLARALREADLVDDIVIGELRGVIDESEEAVGGGAEVVKAMDILRAQIGMPRQSELRRQAELDYADAAEDAARGAASGTSPA